MPKCPPPVLVAPVPVDPDPVPREVAEMWRYCESCRDEEGHISVDIWPAWLGWLSWTSVLFLMRGSIVLGSDGLEGIRPLISWAAQNYSANSFWTGSLGWTFRVWGERDARVMRMLHLPIAPLYQDLLRMDWPDGVHQHAARLAFPEPEPPPEPPAQLPPLRRRARIVLPPRSDT